MKIFVDFDNTIFDTRHDFLDKFFDVFYNYGIDREVFQRTLKEFSKVAGENKECYSPKNHIKEAKKVTGKNIDEEVFLREMVEFLEDLEEYVFEDFYQFVNSFDKKDLIILSYGDREFQKQKINGSGIEQFFTNTIITQGDKTVEIEKYMKNFPDENAMLIDDKSSYFESAKNSEIDIKTIHILRDENVCSDESFCDYHVQDLRTIKNLTN